MPHFDLVHILRSLPPILIGLTLHEFAHALTAHKLGDPTARAAGRLSLNPLKHIEPIGFILLIFAGFGWAKPVEFNPENLKHKRRDEILIALAGPLSNLLLGILFFLIARIVYLIPDQPGQELIFQSVNYLLFCGVLNFGLFVFNLIPLPPLDGSHLYLAFLKTQLSPRLMRNLYLGGSLALLAIVLLENSTDITILPIRPVIQFLSSNLIGVLRF